MYVQLCSMLTLTDSNVTLSFGTCSFQKINLLYIKHLQTYPISCISVYFIYLYLFFFPYIAIVVRC